MNRVAKQPLLWRSHFLMAAILILLVIVFARLYYLQILNHDFLQHQGDLRAVRTQTVKANRGIVLDRHGVPLAVSTPVQSVWVNPKEILSQPVDFALLARTLDMPVQDLREKLEKSSEKSFLYIKRHLSPKQGAAVAELSLPGVYQQTEYRRYYPDGEVLAHLVGTTDIDEKGLEGIELTYNQWLEGRDGRKKVLRDRHGHSIKNLESIVEPLPGKDVQLSIDRRIQYVAYRALKHAVQKHRAKSGSAVVLDVSTGELLAVVNQPSFNPNLRAKVPASVRRNRAITDVFEPGSTAKPLAMAAALSSGLFTPKTVINTAPGYLKVSGSTIRDVRNFGALDLSSVLQKSSNVGMAKLALSMPAEAIWGLYSDMGFGGRTHLGFPGEGEGVLRHYDKWPLTTRATLSYGYGFSVTAVQLAQAYSVLASGGLKRELSLLKMDKTASEQRILPTSISQEVMQMLSAVVSTQGTGHRASIPGYQVAGKTGTVRKMSSEGYLEDRYLAVFAGVAPVSNPRLVTIVIIDDPSTEAYYGGQIAAPVFADIMEESLRLMNISPDDLEKIQPWDPLHFAEERQGAKS